MTGVEKPRYHRIKELQEQAATLKQDWTNPVLASNPISIEKIQLRMERKCSSVRASKLAVNSSQIRRVLEIFTLFSMDYIDLPI